MRLQFAADQEEVYARAVARCEVVNMEEVKGFIEGVATEAELQEVVERLEAVEAELRLLLMALRKGHLQEVDDFERIGKVQPRTAQLRRIARDQLTREL